MVRQACRSNGTDGPDCCDAQSASGLGHFRRIKAVGGRVSLPSIVAELLQRNERPSPRSSLLYGGPGFYRGRWNGGGFGPCWIATPIGPHWNCGSPIVPWQAGQKRRINGARGESAAPPIAPELVRRSEPAKGRDQVACNLPVIGYPACSDVR
jgi:hypothetical protein